MNDWWLEKPLDARKCVQLLPTSNADRFWRIAIDKSCPILLYTNCRKHIHAAVSSQSFVTLYKLRSERVVYSPHRLPKLPKHFLNLSKRWISDLFSNQRGIQIEFKKRPKFIFFLLKFLRAIKHLRKVQNTRGHQNRPKTVRGVVSANPGFWPTNLTLREVDVWIEKDQNAFFFIWNFFGQ